MVYCFYIYYISLLWFTVSLFIILHCYGLLVLYLLYFIVMVYWFFIYYISLLWFTGSLFIIFHCYGLLFLYLLYFIVMVYWFFIYYISLLWLILFLFLYLLYFIVMVNTVSLFLYLLYFIVSVAAEEPSISEPLSLSDLHTSSASQRKIVLLSSPRSSTSETTPTATSSDSHFVLFHTDKLNDFVKPLACPECGTAALRITETAVKGYAVQLQLSCDMCSAKLSTVYSSPQLPVCDNPTRQPFLINRLSVLAAREGGVNQTGLVRLTTLMNIKGGLHSKTFSSISDMLKQKLVYGTAYDALVEAHENVRRVHQEIYGESNGPLQLAVSYDGTWKTRGFHSLFGVGFVIEVLTGLVIDYVIRSKYCVECELVGKKLQGEEKEQWQELHREHCDVNHTGSSSSMETEAAKVMWARSMDLIGAQYTSILGDGDAAVLSALNTLQPYGADVTIEKRECINHMSKRMFKGLEKVVKESSTKGNASTSSKPQVTTSLSGKGKLTTAKMKKWSQYYRNAVVKNAPDVEATRHAIWAIFFHNISTFDDPHHDHCDIDWCYHQQAMAEGVDPEQRWKAGKHDPPIPREASEQLVPLFKRLSDRELLGRCMSLGTSNANESLHAVIWRRAPKAVYSSRKTVEIAVAMGVVQFNNGSDMLVKAAEAVAPQAGSSSQLSMLAKRQDRSRLRKAEVAAKLETRSSRKRKALQRMQADNKQSEEEGHLYDPGAW